MKLSALISILVFTCYTLNSQNGNISGTLLDTLSNPIEYATVKLSVINADNSMTFREGTLTNALGEFTFTNLSLGTYMLEFSHINFQYFFTETTINNNQQKILDPIILTESFNQLDEVVISGKKLPIKKTADKIAISVESNVLSSGGTAADVLKQLSTVNISTEGIVSIKGKSDIEILIDGKPSGLSALQGQGVLDQLDLNSIETIEVITNPSVTKSGSGSGGIINIIRKKNIKKGAKGSINVGLGSDEWYHISPQFSYRTGAINLFANYTYRHRKRLNTNTTIKEQLLSNISQTIDENQGGERIDKRNNIELGLDYFIAEKQYITFSGNYRNRDKTYVQQRQTFVTESNTLTELRIGHISEPETNEGWGATAQYKFTNENDYKLNILLDYIHSVEDEDIFREELVTLENENFIEGKQSFYVDINDRYMLDVENERTIDDNTNFIYGAQAIYRSINQTFNALELNNDSETYEAIPELDDEFNYDDFVTSVYSQFEKNHEQWSYEAAIRLEWFNNTYTSESTNQTFRDQYFKFFPSLKLTYNFNDITNMVLTTRKGINRPSPNRLNPFPDLSNAFNISVGNPKLNPELFYNSELGLNTKINKLSLTTGLFLTYYKDIIQQITELRNDGITYRFPINVNNMYHYGLDFNSQLKISKWWNQQFGGVLYNRTYSDNAIDSSERTTYRVKSTTTLNITKLLEVQVFGSYNSSENTAQGKLKPMHYIDIGLEYNFLDNKSKLSLVATDLFNTLTEKSILLNDNLNVQSEQKINTQRFYLTLSYKL